LGVIITADLKSSSQCIKSAATARRVIGMVRRISQISDLSTRLISGHIWSSAFKLGLHILLKTSKLWKEFRKQQQI